MLLFCSVGRTFEDIGIMFLVEAALGKEHHITEDDRSLVAPPPGFDCIIAKGKTEPGRLDSLKQLISLWFQIKVINIISYCIKNFQT